MRGAAAGWENEAEAGIDPWRVLDGMGDAIIATDEEDRVRGWNRAAEDLFGYTAAEAHGRPLTFLAPPARVARGELEYLRRSAREQGVVRQLFTELLSKGGRLVPVSVTRTQLRDDEGYPAGQCSVVCDVSDQHAAVRRLHDAERLAALRMMAVGLVHELANPLTGILGLLQLAERGTAEAHTRRRLASARREAARLGWVVRKLTGLVRADGSSGKVDVNEALREALVFAHYAHGAAPVTVVLEADAALPPLAASRAEVLQLCLHLLMNAYDAIGSAGGRITVRSRQEADAIVLEFEDDGCGIAPELLPRIFEPFFTTKEPHLGTGLGLFVCERIVSDELGGRLGVESAPGAGSRFTAVLPLRRSPPAPAT